MTYFAKTGTLSSQEYINHQQTSKDSSVVESIHPPKSDIPDGGAVAWLQVLGSFFFFFNAWGIVNSFGAFQTFYEADLLRSSTPSAISWIGSIQGFLILNGSILSGPLFDMGYLKSLICGGSLVLLLGLFMTSLATKYYQILLGHGICVGLGGGLFIVPSLAVVATYFQKKRSFATGLAIAGSSVGGIIYPAVFRQLQPKVGFPWATRIMAFIALGTLSISVAVLKRRTSVEGKRKLFDMSAWKEPPYVLFVMAFFLGFVGLYVPFFFTTTFAIGKIGVGEKLGIYFLTILNAASTLGRIFPNLIADRVGPLNVTILCTLAAGVLAFSWIAVHDIGGLVAFTVLYGFFSGAFISLPPSTITSLSSNLDTVGTRLGMACSFAGLGILIGNPIAGALLDLRTMNFFPAQIFSGATVVAAAILLILARIARTGGSLITVA